MNVVLKFLILEGIHTPVSLIIYHVNILPTQTKQALASSPKIAPQGQGSSSALPDKREYTEWAVKTKRDAGRILCEIFTESDDPVSTWLWPLPYSPESAKTERVRDLEAETPLNSA